MLMFLLLLLAAFYFFLVFGNASQILSHDSLLVDIPRRPLVLSAAPTVVLSSLPFCLGCLIMF